MGNLESRRGPNVLFSEIPKSFPKKGIRGLTVRIGAPLLVVPNAPRGGRGWCAVVDRWAIGGGRERSKIGPGFFAGMFTRMSTSNQSYVRYMLNRMSKFCVVTTCRCNGLRGDMFNRMSRAPQSYVEDQPRTCSRRCHFFRHRIGENRIRDKNPPTPHEKIKNQTLKPP